MTTKRIVWPANFKMEYSVINTNADRDTGNIHRLYNCEELQQMYLHTIPAYVYYIRHIPTGKFYYGARYKHTEKNILPEDDLWKTYFTSSKKVLELRKKDGNDAFEYKIIYKNLNTDECFKFEQRIIKENKSNPLCLNARYFDIDKNKRIFSVFGKTLSTKGKLKTEETKSKMRKPKSVSHRQKISETQKLNGGNGPAKHSLETKNKIRESLKKNPRPNKICPHCNKEGGYIAMARWHFNNCKEKK